MCSFFVYKVKGPIMIVSDIMEHQLKNLILDVIIFIAVIYKNDIHKHEY